TCRAIRSRPRGVSLARHSYACSPVRVADRGGPCGRAPACRAAWAPARRCLSGASTVAPACRRAASPSAAASPTAAISTSLRRAGVLFSKFMDPLVVGVEAGGLHLSSQLPSPVVKTKKYNISVKYAVRTGKETTMAIFTRRSLLQGSVGLTAACTLARPYIVNAQAKTMTMWFAQGFVEDEDVALRKAVAGYEKASGNKVELSIMPFAPMRQKIVSAITSGVVPDVTQNNPAEILQLYAWQDKWIEIEDVVETQRAKFSQTALSAAQAYNDVTKKRAFYGVPIRGACVPCHTWKSLVEKAGMNLAERPRTWNAYFDFYKKVQD